ncbi:MAG: hypothetical protein GY862_17840 [Gammaproteobacteria bacterium]|nr:hypothetical protein [Gammaproteobacteria bacterium]
MPSFAEERADSARQAFSSPPQCLQLGYVYQNQAEESWAFREPCAGFSFQPGGEKGNLVVPLLEVDGRPGFFSVTLELDFSTSRFEVIHAKELVLPVNALLELQVSSPTLASAGEGGVTLTARLKTSDNNPIEGIPISFSATSGLIQSIAQTTSAAGIAEARLTAGDNPLNRNIEVTVWVGGASCNDADGGSELDSPLCNNVQTVEVIGTTISIQGPAGAALGSTPEFDIFLKDSAGNGIGGQALAITSEAGNSIQFIENGVPVMDYRTNPDGQLKVRVAAMTAKEGIDHDNNPVTPAVSGDTLTAAALMEEYENDNLMKPAASRSFKIFSGNFMIEPEAPEDVMAGESKFFTVHWDKNGEPQSGKKIYVSTTRGEIAYTTGTGPFTEEVFSGNTSNAGGNAQFSIHADTPGSAVVSISAEAGADGIAPSIQVSFNFVADAANSIVLQAHPDWLGVNAPASSAEQSEIIAMVRNSGLIDSVPVQHARVNFMLQDVTGGALSPASACTDEFGRVSTVYTAGSSPSAANGVYISAAIAGFCVGNGTCTAGDACTDAVALTVTGKYLFVTLGTSNKLINDGAARYAMPYTALVTDADGIPVSEAAVSLNTYIQMYRKGSPRAKLSVDCPNEDFNRNGLLEENEDINKNGRLEPGNVITTDLPVITTDSSGYAHFNLIYPKQYAALLRAELTARASLDWSEGSNTVIFETKCLADDCPDDDTISWPNEPNPFGEGGCFVD